MEELIHRYERDTVAEEVIAECSLTPYSLSFFSYHDGLLRYKGKLFVGSSTALRATILQYMHSSGYGGHSTLQPLPVPTQAW